MNRLERLNLEKMINENDVKDETENIRNKKHSNLIKEDVIRMVELKKKYFRLEISNPKEFESICISRCNFLFTNYTDIFNKIKKNEIDLNILMKFLEVLKNIEDEKVNQHEGSYQVGKILKELYIDSALKKSEKLDKKYKSKDIENKGKNISWKDYKNKHLLI